MVLQTQHPSPPPHQNQNNNNSNNPNLTPFYYPQRYQIAETPNPTFEEELKRMTLENDIAKREEFDRRRKAAIIEDRKRKEELLRQERAEKERAKEMKKTMKEEEKQRAAKIEDKRRDNKKKEKEERDRQRRFNVMLEKKLEIVVKERREDVERSVGSFHEDGWVGNMVAKGRLRFRSRVGGEIGREEMAEKFSKENKFFVEML